MNQKLTLEFTHAEFQIVTEAVINLPYRVAAPLIKSMQDQLNAKAAQASANVAPIREPGAA